MFYALPLNPFNFLHYGLTLTRLVVPTIRVTHIVLLPMQYLTNESFEAFTAVMFQGQVFWFVTLCSVMAGY
jgi:hypothetical protein